MRLEFLCVCWRERRKAIHVTALAVLLCGTPSGVDAHHSGHELSIPSPKCGWIEGEELRDRRNLTDFCARWVPGELRITSASALRERLWIEAPVDLASTLRDDARTTAALLRDWLERWRKTAGYKTASVILLRRHIEFARIQTTMTGDVVTIR